MTRVYLAGPYSSRDLLVGYGAEVTRIGYTLTARWLDGTHEVCTNDDLEASATEKQRIGWAMDDLEDVRKSDVVVAFTSAAVGGGGHSGGRHVETGYALARAKSVVLVGEPENVFHWLPGITRVPDWHEALIELSARLVNEERSAPRAAYEPDVVTS